MTMTTWLNEGIRGTGNLLCALTFDSKPDAKILCKYLIMCRTLSPSSSLICQAGGNVERSVLVFGVRRLLMHSQDRNGSWVLEYPEVPSLKLLETTALKLPNHNEARYFDKATQTWTWKHQIICLGGRCALRMYLHGTHLIGMSQPCLGWNLIKSSISLTSMMLSPGLWGLMTCMRHCHRPSPKKVPWHSTSHGAWTELAHVCLQLLYAKWTHADGLTFNTMWQIDDAFQIFACWDKGLIFVCSAPLCFIMPTWSSKAVTVKTEQRILTSHFLIKVHEETECKLQKANWTIPQ